MTSAGIDWQREKWQSGLGSKFIHQGEKNAAKYADEVIVLSKGVQDYFKETYGRETHFIPNGVNNHYPGLDVVRVIAIAGIVLMHVLANGNYDLRGFLFEKVIGTAGNFTILFMMVSAFGMCCGYYEKFKAGTINIEAL